jgi:predicted deacylase
MSDIKPSLISTDIDFEGEGVNSGFLRVPYSNDRSAYGRIPIPIVVAKRGTGPTVLLTGANHGDEYEGPVALMNFMRETKFDALSGRLIVIPALNYPAYLNGSRTSPIDNGNLNRLFPGDRNGTVTEMIAHYIESVLLPMADYVMDFHSGGSSLNYLPTLFSGPLENSAAGMEMRKLIEAFAPPRVLAWNSLGEDRVFRAAARRAGKPMITGEFGGAATVSREGVDVIRTGIAGVLDYLSILPNEKRARTPDQIQRLTVSGPKNYLFSPCAGVFEPFFKLGDQISMGQVAGVIHDPAFPWKAPTPIHFESSGIAVCTRTYALVEPGDCLGHTAEEM